jgi:magnesium transporter
MEVPGCRQGGGENEAGTPCFQGAGVAAARKARYDAPALIIAHRMLVNCVVYQRGRKVADIPVEAISDYVARPDCLVWVGLFEPSDEELEVMRQEFGLHELALEDARKGDQRPKIEEYGDSLFVVMRTLDLDPSAPNGLLTGEVHAFAARNYILTIRRRTPKGFTDVRARCEREPENLRMGAGFVLYAIMDTVVDRYFPVVEGIEAELEKLEAQMFKETPTRAAIEAFYDLKYRLMDVRHAVSPLLDASNKLFGGRVPPVVAGCGEYYRDGYDHLQRLNASIDAIREMLQTATQVTLTLISLGDSETTKKLAAWGALITVPTLIAGIYGMNFEHMPELHWLFGYPLAIAIMVVVDAWLYQRFRATGWI